MSKWEPFQYAFSARGLAATAPHLELVVANKLVELELRPRLIPEKNPEIPDLMREFEFTGFRAKIRHSEPFGFEGALDVRQEAGKTYFDIPLPSIETLGNPCHFCDGIRGGEEDPCRLCQGKGQITKHDYNLLCPIGASIALLTHMLRYNPWAIAENAGEPNLPLQLMHATTWAGIDRQSIGAKVNPVLEQWLASIEGSVLEPIRSAMQSCYETLLPSSTEPQANHSFQVSHMRGLIHLTCPGNACGLDPSSMGHVVGSGYELSPHNVDTGVQVLTLLAGLATISDIALTARVGQ